MSADKEAHEPQKTGLLNPNSPGDSFPDSLKIVCKYVKINKQLDYNTQRSTKYIKKFNPDFNCCIDYKN